MREGEHHFVVASDIIRDGLGVELWCGEEMVAEVFRHDGDKRLMMNCFRKEIPFILIEKMVSMARQRLGEFEDGEPLPKPID